MLAPRTLESTDKYRLMKLGKTRVYRRDVQRGGNAMAYPPDKAVVDGNAGCARCARFTLQHSPNLHETPEGSLTAKVGAADFTAGVHDAGLQRPETGLLEPDSPW
jgi:hypothetical protein